MLLIPKQSTISITLILSKVNDAIVYVFILIFKTPIHL